MGTGLKPAQCRMAPLRCWKPCLAGPRTPAHKWQLWGEWIECAQRRGGKDGGKRRVHGCEDGSAAAQSSRESKGAAVNGHPGTGGALDRGPLVGCSWRSHPVYQCLL